MIAYQRTPCTLQTVITGHVYVTRSRQECCSTPACHNQMRPVLLPSGLYIHSVSSVMMFVVFMLHFCWWVICAIHSEAASVGSVRWAVDIHGEGF